MELTLETTVVESHGFSFRIRTSRGGDMDVINEIVGRDDYRLNLMKAAGFNPKVIVDVGAHIGSFSVLAHSLWPQATIVCLEPNPESFQLLEQNCPFAMRLRAAIRYDDADFLTDADVATGAGFMTTREAYESNAATKRSQDGYSYRIGYDNIPLLTFEKICDLLNLGQIDLLKLDCEGSEIHLLENMDRSRGGRIGFVLGEYHCPGGFTPFQSLAQECLPHLEFFGGSQAPIGLFWTRRRD